MNNGRDLKVKDHLQSTFAMARLLGVVRLLEKRIFLVFFCLYFFFMSFLRATITGTEDLVTR